MAALANVALFFVFFLPLTLGVGVLGDFYVGRYQSPEEAAPIFYWIVVGWRFLLPSLLFIPVYHAVLALVRRFGGEPDRARLRRLNVVLFPLGLLFAHLLVWGSVVLSVPLLVSFAIPGALFGWVARIPSRASRSPVGQPPRDVHRPWRRAQ